MEGQISGIPIIIIPGCLLPLMIIGLLSRKIFTVSLSFVIYY